ncbi:MAG TPA: hypothetical protein VHH36_07925, partial [Candidatus Thermoplasmatota archaeon]|nr:hypothetical protein [Candidatus Thermoplasmatota archaeon]
QVATARQQVQVPRSVTLAVTASEERFELLQGNDKTLAFTVRNTGNAPGLVNFSVTQAPTRGEDWTVQITPEQARIEPGAETTVSVVVDAPLTGASGDKNVITFHASEGTYDATRAVTAYVDAQFGAELGTPNETLEFEGRASRTLSITVRNTGNTDDAFNVTAAVGSASSDWNVTVHQPVVQVPHGATRTVTLTIVPTVAEPRAATLTVRAVSQGSLDGDESSVQVTLQAKEPEPVEEGESLIPAPAPLLAALAVALAALARRARGGRP